MAQITFETARAQLPAELQARMGTMVDSEIVGIFQIAVFQTPAGEHFAAFIAEATLRSALMVNDFDGGANDVPIAATNDNGIAYFAYVDTTLEVACYSATDMREAATWWTHNECAIHEASEEAIAAHEAALVAAIAAAAA